jgi:hypothetical protein
MRAMDVTRYSLQVHYPRRELSQRPPVEVLNRNAIQVNSFKAANIDGAHSIALWIGAFAVRVNATGSAKMVLDNVLVERICAEVLFRRQQAKLFARHKPHERSFAGTHGAIASHCPIEFAFYLERNFTAVTAAFVLHTRPPLTLVAAPKNVLNALKCSASAENARTLSGSSAEPAKTDSR